VPRIPQAHERIEQDLANALRVLLYTPELGKLIEKTDPQAFKQAHNALVTQEVRSTKRRQKREQAAARLAKGTS
jgi:hypothetical protein